MHPLVIHGPRDLRLLLKAEIKLLQHERAKTVWIDSRL